MRADVLGRHPLAAACVCSAALWTCFFAAFAPRYATNDDPLMAMLPAGAGFVSAPDEHLIFTNVIAGRALRALNRAAPAVPWYGAYLLAAHVLASIALLYAALRAGPSWTRAALALVWLAVAAVPFANGLHFTVTALVAAQSGLLLALGLLHRPRSGETGTAAAAVALAVLGSLIRFEAFALALALAAPAALAVGWRAGRAAWARPAAVLAATLVLAAGARAYDSAYYARSAEWTAYREFNRTLAQFVDFERAKEYTPQSAGALRAVGWSRNDHRLLLNWFHPDGDVFNAAKLRAVLAETPLVHESPGARLRIGLRRVLRNRPGRLVLLALPMALIACGAAPASRRAVLAETAAAAAALVCLILFLKAPPHVYLPVLAWPLALALVLPAAPWPSRIGRLALAAAAVVAGVAAVRAVALQREESADGRVRERAYRQEVEALRAPADRLYVLWSTFPYHVTDPLSRVGTTPPERFLALGWPERTPAAARTLSSLGYRGFFDALADPRTRLVAPVEMAGWIEQYAERHHHLALVLAPEGTLAGMTVFRPAVSASGAAADRVLRSEPSVPE